MTYPPVKQLHSQANLLAAKFEQGEGANYIDDAINLDREALELCQPGHQRDPFLYLSLRFISVIVMTSLEQEGTLRRPLSSNERH